MNIATRTSSLLSRWWRSQSPSRQDRYAAIAPLIAVLLFFTAIVTAFGYLRLEEIGREREAVKRDAEYAHQRLRLRLLEQQEQLQQLARDAANGTLDVEDFFAIGKDMSVRYPEIQAMVWVDGRRKLRATFATASARSAIKRAAGDTLAAGETDSTYAVTRDLRRPVYSRPAEVTAAGVKGAIAHTFELQVPIADPTRFAGVIMAEYTVDGLLRYGLPEDTAIKYAVALVNEADKVIAGNTAPARNPAAAVLPFAVANDPYETPIATMNNGLYLRTQPYRTSLGLVGNGLFWLVATLSVMTAWMLIGTWRHTRRRVQAQAALLAETNFRRAMENSMLTGMRALDMQGRITYVNPAFCQMSGWSDAELVGRTAPFPYWPEDDRDALAARLDEELSGRTTPGGFQVRVKRRNGSIFDARMYVSPLVDAKGVQTGWMTSVTDITEPNRVREQLAASYERFTTVLDALDAAVSVTPLGSNELVFANRMYRQWFGATATGHLKLVVDAGAPPELASETLGAASAPRESADSQYGFDTVDALAGLPTSELVAASSENAEIYLHQLGKWVEVRSRYLTWVDGRLAQMVISSDITARRSAEDAAEAQTERAQSASRLITMGEMASSVAHELNQPLTAINNYCMGMVTRIQNNNIDNDGLIAALEKTAKQAQRAGQIIQRIRSFVKKSAPNRVPSDVTDIVNEAMELAEIELRRRNVRISPYIAQRLPKLLVDPILIEQVLINLLKHAGEAVDNAARPPGKRNVELRVAPREENGQRVVEFAVTDTGKGLAPQVVERLYEAFFSTKADGMGIGLNLCRSIVESHQGRMEAQNIYNGQEVTGCKFKFWLPVHDGLDAASEQPSESPSEPIVGATP